VFFQDPFLVLREVRSELANEIGKAKYVLAEYDKIKRIIDPNARASYI